jgi:DNA-binding transcriptional LysR family regulator
MTLQQLNDVIAIAETGSFNRAAERLYMRRTKRIPTAS